MCVCACDGVCVCAYLFMGVCVRVCVRVSLEGWMCVHVRSLYTCHRKCVRVRQAHLCRLVRSVDDSKDRVNASKCLLSSACSHIRRISVEQKTLFQKSIEQHCAGRHFLGTRRLIGSKSSPNVDGAFVLDTSSAEFAPNDDVSDTCSASTDPSNNGQAMVRTFEMD